MALLADVDYDDSARPLSEATRSRGIDLGRQGNHSGPQNMRGAARREVVEKVYPREKRLPLRHTLQRYISSRRKLSRRSSLPG